MKSENVQVIRAANDWQVYSAASLAKLAADLGIYKDDRLKYFRQNCQRIIKAFPDKEDGRVKIVQQQKSNAWFGWRYKIYAGIYPGNPSQEHAPEGCPPRPAVTN